jgi:aminoglycoside phosphotransferase
MSDVLLKGCNGEIALPAKIARLVKGAEVSLCMNSMSPSSVFKIALSDKTAYLKCSPAIVYGTSFDVFIEKVKYDFLSGKVIIPEIIECEESENYHFMLMSAVSGKDLLDIALSGDYEKYLHFLNMGLTALRTIQNCPFTNTLTDVFRQLDHVIKLGLFVPDSARYEAMKKKSFKEVLVASHGDIRNLICKNDETAFLDVGKFGLADQNYDLATAFLEIKKHFGVKSAEKYLADTTFSVDMDKLNFFSELESLLIGL